MKKIFFCVIAMFLFGNILFADVCEDALDGFSCEDSLISETVILDEYPYCEIPITYIMKECINSNGDRKVVFQLQSYTIPDTPFCSAFKDDNKLPDGTPDWDFIIWFTYRAFEELALSNFLNEYNNAHPTQKPMYECPNNGNITYSFILSHCISYSIEPYIYGPSGPPLWRVSLDPCTSDICCERTIHYCYNVQTDEIEVTQDVIDYVGGDCGNPPDKPNADFQSPCFEQCFIPQR